MSLDSPEPPFRDYLTRVKQKVRVNWGFPCVVNPPSKLCEYKDAQVSVEFGILKNGTLA